MSKIQVTTALERQLPEFIREDYTTFVKFIQAYYEFLGQTNNRNLEDIRSIDRTLDDFVSKFKKELAAIFPTGNMANERMFLEHISDFYNARGSVESYKLLFRVLFNKDSAIFYPSTQILKASDGKWVQEKSVFVKSVSGDLFDLKGQIVQLNTIKKTINVFSPNVILYRDDIFEVFIDKQYYNDIAIGDTIEFNGASGIILPCPTKYKIVEEGAGFEVGSIYNLPTATGNGSTIKITRVGSLGEIKSLQIISFGLDYQTNFYAKLSNKSTQALAFYHPITQYIAGAPRDPLLEPTATYGFPDENPASQDQISDYIQFGYFINQNYFYYDLNYTANDVAIIDALIDPETGIDFDITVGAVTGSGTYESPWAFNVSALSMTSATISTVGTVSSIAGTGTALDPWTFDVTDMTSTTGAIVGARLIVTQAGTGKTYGGTDPTTLEITSILSNTSIAVKVIGAAGTTTPIAGAITAIACTKLYVGGRISAVPGTGRLYGGNRPSSLLITNVYTDSGVSVRVIGDVGTTTPVAGSITNLSDNLSGDTQPTVWFADTSYVGDIIASFYTNEAGVVIDEDTAEIKITLGPVAIYPGYYSTNDGFVSDESYIQDGDYYQQFSYVVKIEEQLETYKEIVKSLLQPAGLKIFGEYNIYKNFDVIASPLLAFIRRQFFDQIFQFSQFYYADIEKPLDDSYSTLIEAVKKDVNKYLVETQGLSEIVAKAVTKLLAYDTENNYAQLGDSGISKKEVTKLLFETQGLSETVIKDVTKVLPQDLINSILESVIKDVTKVLPQDLITSILETVAKDVGLNKSDDFVVDETVAKAVAKVVTQDLINSIFESVAKDVIKVLPEDLITSILETVAKNIGLNKSDDFVVDETVAKNNNKVLPQDLINSLLENVVKSLTKINVESISVIDGDVLKDIVKVVTQDLITSILETVVKNVGLNKSDDFVVDETQLVKNITQGNNFEIINTLDQQGKVLTNIVPIESASIIENVYNLELTLVKSDIFSTSEVFSRTVNYSRSFVDSQILTDSIAKYFTPNTIQENISFSDGEFFLGALFDRSFEDNINSIIEGSTLYFNTYSATTMTVELTDDYFSQEYAVVNTLTIT